MAELSPALRVMVAVTHVYQEHGGEPPARAVAAAALRAAVEQCRYTDDYGDDWINPVELLSIARELEQAP